MGQRSIENLFSFLFQFQSFRHGKTISIVHWFQRKLFYKASFNSAMGIQYHWSIHWLYNSNSLECFSNAFWKLKLKDYIKSETWMEFYFRIHPLKVKVQSTERNYLRHYYLRHIKQLLAIFYLLKFIFSKGASSIRITVHSPKRLLWMDFKAPFLMDVNCDKWRQISFETSTDLSSFSRKISRE